MFIFSHVAQFFFIVWHFFKSNLHPLLIFCPYASLWKEFLSFLGNYNWDIGKMWLDFLKTCPGWIYPVPSILFPLSFPLQFFSVSLEVRSPNLDLVLQVCPHKCQMDWNNHSPGLADCPLVDANCDKVSFHCCKGTLLEHTQIAIHQDLPNHARHAFTCCEGLLHPRRSI